MLHAAEVYAAIADSTDEPAVRGWAEVSRLLADPAARLRVVPDDPDDCALAAFLDPESWWRLADLRRHAGLAVRLPGPWLTPPPSADRALSSVIRPPGGGRPVVLTADDLGALLERLPAGDPASGWADGGGGPFPVLGLRGSASRRPAAITLALLADRADPLSVVLKAWAARPDFRGGYAAGFHAAGANPPTPDAFVRAGLPGAAPAAVRHAPERVARLLESDVRTGLAAGRRVLDEDGLAIALGLRVDPSDRPALAALLAATGDPSAATALRDLYALEPDLPLAPRLLFEGILGRRLEAV